MYKEDNLFGFIVYYEIVKVYMKVNCNGMNFLILKMYRFFLVVEKFEWCLIDCNIFDVRW